MSKWPATDKEMVDDGVAEKEMEKKKNLVEEEEVVRRLIQKVDWKGRGDYENARRWWICFIMGVFW